MKADPNKTISININDGIGVQPTMGATQLIGAIGINPGTGGILYWNGTNFYLY
jgi:hypothetical protein